MAAVVAAMFLAACTGGKGDKADEEEDLAFTTPEAVVNALSEKVKAGDKTVIAEAVKTVQDELMDVVDSGDMYKAEEYASKIKVFVTENEDKLEEMDISTNKLKRLLNAILNLPLDVEAADSIISVE